MTRIHGLKALAISLGIAACSTACGNPGGSVAPFGGVPAGGAQDQAPAPRQLPAQFPGQSCQNLPQTVQPTEPTLLTFDLFGMNKIYDTVTALVQPSPSGQQQTVIMAMQGPDTLKMIVDGTGIGQHAIQSVAIKDEKLGGQERQFDNSGQRLNAMVTFTEFDLPGGRIAGTFTARYNGFPPVSIRNGRLIAGIAMPAAATDAAVPRPQGL
ncbi:MAG: hypothetical protein H7338_05050 [Candidatus Sericytochromatia bacterium]|nr:hypothetical protein [Candidatus Sericytochromatia bacterium]